MIFWVRLAAAGAVLAGAAYGGWQVRDWQADAAELARQKDAARTALRRQEAATGAAQSFEEVRDAIRRELLATTPRFAPALASAVPQCETVAVGDVVLPAGALDRVRLAAGEFALATDPGEPGSAVQPGPGAADR